MNVNIIDLIRLLIVYLSEELMKYVLEIPR